MTEKPITEEMIRQTRAFHGHMCPGLAMGIRAAEVALREIGPHSQDEEVVAVVETDMCGVDAIQFLIGCTFGKGNLIHLDYGKSAFTFYRRSDGKAVRVVAKPGGSGPPDPEWQRLREKWTKGTLTPEEQERFKVLHEARCRQILGTPLEQLFEMAEPRMKMPRPARIMESVSLRGVRRAHHGDQNAPVPGKDALHPLLRETRAALSASPNACRALGLTSVSAPSFFPEACR